MIQKLLHSSRVRQKQYEEQTDLDFRQVSYHTVFSPASKKSQENLFNEGFLAVWFMKIDQRKLTVSNKQ